MNIKQIKKEIEEGNLFLHNNKLYTKQEWVQINHAKNMVAKYDLLQNTKKVQLNSSYGSLLSQWFRWFDERMGASVTATGRQITTHMIKTAGLHITGQEYELVKTTEVDKKGKVTHVYTSECPAIIYGDTDSCYFKTMTTNKQEAIKVADETANIVNNSFQPFMKEAFLCGDGYDNLIKTVREIVGVRGLFQARKKYVIKVVDQEGKSTDKLKAMGSEIKKSDTPKIIQKFLKNILDRVLNGETYENLEEYVNGSRKELFKGNKSLINLGIAKAVNNLDMLYDEWKRIEKPGKRRLNLPGHVRASVNYNEYVQKVEGPNAKLLKSGDKVLIFYLKPNSEGFTNIAIPSEMTKLPKWFSNFSVDVEATETKMIDAKLEGIFRSWGYDVPTFQGSLLNKLLVF